MGNIDCLEQQLQSLRDCERWLEWIDSVRWGELLSASMMYAENSLGMRPTNERCRYIVTTSLIGWVHTSAAVKDD